jgi:Putative Actinobacterial Holin-X, holin superfamily III
VRIEQPGRSSPGAVGPDKEPSTADLIKGIADDASTLVKQEILLARQELTEGLAKVAAGSALLVVAGLLGLYALGFLFETLAWSLEALGLPKSASFGIVTLLLLLVAAILGLVGQRRLAKAKVAPERAQAGLRGATADLAAEAKVAAAEVKADLTGSVRAVREEASARPARLREQVAAKVRRDGRGPRDEEDQGGADRG